MLRLSVQNVNAELRTAEERYAKERLTRTSGYLGLGIRGGPVVETFAPMLKGHCKQVMRARICPGEGTLSDDGRCW